MKNKKAEQIALKKKHKEEIRQNRRSEPVFERNVPTIQEKPTILIVCEGKNTEPSYFKQFRLSTATIKTVGEGYNTISLVKRALEILENETYDQVWCVFDKDDFTENDFNNAIKLAEKSDLKVAYSNQAFEYWILLHFDDHQGGSMHRKDYHNKINMYLKPFGIEYDGKDSKTITEDLFNLLDGYDKKTKKERKFFAIERAKRNYNIFDHKNDAKKESSSTVFLLVEEILKYI